MQGLHLSKLPEHSAAATGFGRGYTIGLATCMVLIAVSGVEIFAIARDDASVYRGAGHLLISFGAGFLFGALYGAAKGRRIPWSISGFGKFRSGAFDRQANPFGFWLSLSVPLLLGVFLIAGGVWIHINAKHIAETHKPLGSK